MKYIRNLLHLLRSLPARTRLFLAVLLGSALVGGASAQTAPASGGYTLDLGNSITSFGSAMTGTITTNSPQLFGILAISVGFYFLWGRVRALF